MNLTAACPTRVPTEIHIRTNDFSGGFLSFLGTYCFSGLCCDIKTIIAGTQMIEVKNPNISIGSAHPGMAVRRAKRRKM
jgi:hypothetical protein